jgi:hypothetical protein
MGKKIEKPAENKQKRLVTEAVFMIYYSIMPFPAAF